MEIESNPYSSILAICAIGIDIFTEAPSECNFVFVRVRYLF